MTTRLHYYGSTFTLSDKHTDEMWRTIIGSYFDEASANRTTLIVWFDLDTGGHVSLRLHADTPLAVSTD